MRIALHEVLKEERRPHWLQKRPKSAEATPMQRIVAIIQQVRKSCLISSALVKT